MIRSMVAAIAGAALALFAVPALAQDDRTLEEKYKEKVAESWFTSNGFTDDYDVAREKAKTTGKPIFAYFTRSYAG